MKVKKFKRCYLVLFEGTSTTLGDGPLTLIEQSIEENLASMLSAIQVGYTNGEESVTAKLGSVACTDKEGVKHTCLKNVLLENSQ